MPKGTTVKKLPLFPVSVLAFAMLQPAYSQVQGLWVSTGTMQSGREYNALIRMASGKAPVSYTHLTLPTIYSV